MKHEAPANEKKTGNVAALSASAWFDELPDCARAALPTVCRLYDVAPATIWRRVKAGLVPAPVKEGGSTRWVVGDLRRALAK